MIETIPTGEILTSATGRQLEMLRNKLNQVIEEINKISAAHERGGHFTIETGYCCQKCGSTSFPCKCPKDVTAPKTSLGGRPTWIKFECKECGHQDKMAALLKFYECSKCGRILDRRREV